MEKVILSEKHIDNILRQRIIFYAKTAQWREKMFNKVLEYYPEPMINRVIKAKDEYKIELIDGGFIKFVFPSKSRRGLRATMAIVEDEMDLRTLNEIIRPVIRNYGELIEVAEKRQ